MGDRNDGPKVLYRVLSTPAERALGRVPTNRERGEVKKELALMEAADNQEAEIVYGMQTGASFQHIRSNLRHRAALNAASKQISLARSAAASTEADESGTGETTYERELREAQEKLPHWRSVLTLRAAVAATFVGAVFAIVALKMGLSSGVQAHLNVGAGLLSYFTISSWRKVFGRWKWLAGKPFTAQEATVIQAAAVACYGMIHAGGFYTYVIAMSTQAYENLGTSTPGNTLEGVVDPTFVRTMIYLFCISMFGVFMLVPIRRKLVIDLDLPYPSGTATGAMINSFFSEAGSAVAALQVRSLMKWFSLSFLWSGFMWIWTGKTNGCGAITGGLKKWPTFGIPALEYTWNWNWQQMYVGLGMLSPPTVAFSMLFGAIISWGLMWPLIDDKEGDWYPAGLPKKSVQGMEGYRVFLAMGLILADGLYIMVKLGVLYCMSRKDRQAGQKQGTLAVQRSLARRATLPRTLTGATARSAAETARGSMLAPLNEEKSLEVSGELAQGSEGSYKLASDDGDTDNVTPEELDEMEKEQVGGVDTAELRKRIFMGETIPTWVALVGYLCFLGLAVGVVPLLYPPARWYFVLMLGALAPFAAMANAYGVGLTDWSTAGLWGKIVIFVFGAWAGQSGNGVIAGLVRTVSLCGVLFASCSNSAEMMQDFQTGYLTLSSPKSMFVAQVFGAAIGCVVAPACFQLYYSAFPLGQVDGGFPAPMGDIYRAIAVVSTTGVSALPDNCMLLAGVFFGIGLLINLLRDLLPHKFARFLPIPLAMAIPFYLGAWLGISTVIGALIVMFWHHVNPEDCEIFHHAVACGLISGDGIWTIPEAILALAGVQPPLCMGWTSSL